MCAQLATGVTPLLRGVFDPTACEPQGCPEEPVWLSARWCDSTRAAGRAWPRGAALCVCLLQAKHGGKHFTGILLVSPQIPGVWVQTHSGMRSVAPGGLQDLKRAFTVNCFPYVSTFTLAPHPWPRHRVFDSHPRRCLEVLSGVTPNPSQGNLYEASGLFL